jgi:hypothetical protein
MRGFYRGDAGALARGLYLIRLEQAHREKYIVAKISQAPTNIFFGVQYSDTELHGVWRE